MPALRTILMAVVVAAAASAPLRAHDFWVLVSESAEGEGRQITAAIGGGHHFPNSEIAVRNTLIASMRWLGDDGASADIDSEQTGRERVGRLNLPGPGEGAVEVVIQNPRRPKPEAIAVGLTEKARPAPRGQGLELVPLLSPADWRPGHAFPVEASRDGTPVAAKWTIVPERGSTKWASSSPGKPAELTLQPGQRYLIATAIDGTALTLTFRTPSAP